LIIAFVDVNKTYLILLFDVGYMSKTIVVLVLHRHMVTYH